MKFHKPRNCEQKEKKNKLKLSAWRDTARGKNAIF